MIEICLFVIAFCEVVRMLQNAKQLLYFHNDEQMRKDLNNQFVDSLNKDNSEFVHDLLKAYQITHEEQENKGEEE